MNFNNLQIPSHDLNWQEMFPSLYFVGTDKCVKPDESYEIDSDVQLVCKYLHAFKKGTINQQYKEEGPLVKFSLCDDFSQDVCNKLLNDYMPSKVKTSKVTQKLFIRYYCYFFKFNFLSLHIKLQIHEKAMQVS